MKELTCQYCIHEGRDTP